MHTTHTHHKSFGQLLWQVLRQYRIGLLLLLLLISCGLFLTLNVNGHWDFALPLRGKKLLMLMVVAYAIGVSTLLFQTITNNPILTPALLGFDSLYILLQSVMVFMWGAISYSGIDPSIKFGLETLLMIGAALLLFRLLFTRTQQDLTRMILVGVIMGVLFRSLSALVARLIDPDEFVVVQASSYAQFNNVNTNLLGISSVIAVVTAVLIWRWRYQCDVLLLGRNVAINLGLDYRRFVLKLLSVIAVLVSVSTALVGPVTFFGLLVCALTNQISRQMYHTQRLIIVTVVAMICLVLGQTLFEHVLRMASVLSVVIEFIGGIAFIVLLLFYYSRTQSR